MNPLHWLSARFRKGGPWVDSTSPPFVGPPLPSYAQRDQHGRVFRWRSWWNDDFTLHRIKAVTLDGQPLPYLPGPTREAGDLADFEPLPGHHGG